MSKLRKSSIYLLIGILLLLARGREAEGQTVEIPDAEGRAGSSVMVPILFRNVVGIAGAEIVLTFDPQILVGQAVNLSQSMAGVSLADTIANASGKIAISLAIAEGITVSNAKLVEIDFSVRANADTGTTELRLQTATLYDESTKPIAVTVKHGRFRVVSSDSIIVRPNPFTPNSDSKNDYVNFIIPDRIAQNPEIFIFSSAGKKLRTISAKNGSAFQWDGRDESGKEMQPGVYIYLIQESGKSVKDGTVTLIR